MKKHGTGSNGTGTEQKIIPYIVINFTQFIKRKIMQDKKYVAFTQLVGVTMVGGRGDKEELSSTTTQGDHRMPTERKP
jgi:hypothetical protein